MRNVSVCYMIFTEKNDNISKIKNLIDFEVLKNKNMEKLDYYYEECYLEYLIVKKI